MLFCESHFEFHEEEYCAGECLDSCAFRHEEDVVDSFSIQDVVAPSPFQAKPSQGQSSYQNLQMHAVVLLFLSSWWIRYG
jgi:hypothetical protein